MFKAILFILTFLLFLACGTKSVEQVKVPPPKPKLIVLSIDGLPASYFKRKSRARRYMPNLLQLAAKGRLATNITSINPTLTFPAHTSMVTGVDPAEHGVISNHPPELFDTRHGEWSWYSADLKATPIWEKVNAGGGITANIYWPVTVGANIRYSIPQYSRFRNHYDVKLLAALSSPGFYQELANRTGIQIHEKNIDVERVQAGIYVVQKYEPDLTLIYTTDLDTVHHGYGTFHARSLATLQKVDNALGELFDSLKLFSRKDLALLVVSDHGFNSYQGACFPNVILRKAKMISSRHRTYRMFFQSHAGFAYLRENPESRSLKGRAWIKLKRKIIRQLNRKCPGVRVLTKGKEFEALRQDVHPEAKMILVSEGKTAILEKATARRLYYSRTRFHTHGLPASHEKMATVMLGYPASLFARQPKSVKDVYSIICSYLKLNSY